MNMNTQRYLLAILATFSLLAPLSAQVVKEAPKDAPKEEPKTFRVPMTMLPSRHFLVKVMIDGKGPFQLILDTGAPLTIMNTKTAKAAGLIKKDASSGFSIFGGVNQIQIGKLEIGDVITDKTPAVVMDHPTVQAISDAFVKDHGTIDGIVGFPFFARYAMTVDYQKKELLFTPNGYKPGDYLQDMMKSLMSATERNEPRTLLAGGLWGFNIDKDKGDDEAGVTVKKVFAEGAASSGGLEVGDRILTIDGRWTDTIADTFLATSLVKPGKPVTVVVRRGKDEKKLTVTPTKGR